MLARRKKVSRQAAGAMKGSRPSMINISAKAVSSELPMKESVARRASRILHEAEEVGARINHHHVILARETRAIGLEATVEGVEVRALAVGVGVDRGCLRVALTHGLLGRTISLGDDDLALTIGIRTNALGLGGAQRTELVGHALALGFHAALDRLRHLVGQI